MAKCNSTGKTQAKLSASRKKEDAEIDALLSKLDNEGPQVPYRMTEEVDARLKSDWVRRASIAFLERPFKEMTTKFAEDRQTAITFAVLYHKLPETIERYKGLAGLLETAKIRLMIALCSREDMEAVLEEARQI